MNLKCEEGYGFMSLSRCGQNKHSLVQLKSIYVKELKEMFQTEIEAHNKDEIQQELDEILDLVLSSITRMIEMKLYKQEFINDEELNKRFT